MEEVYCVVNGSLSEVNRALERGGKVKMIHSTHVGGRDCCYCYIVVEKPDSVNDKPRR